MAMKEYSVKAVEPMSKKRCGAIVGSLHSEDKSSLRSIILDRSLR